MCPPDESQSIRICRGLKFKRKSNELDVEQCCPVSEVCSCLNSFLCQFLKRKPFSFFRIDQSAVAIIKGDGDKIKGVVRFSVVTEDKHTSGCIVDGVIDGLTAGLHGIHVHECGDLSNGCESLGQHYNPRQTKHGGPDSDIDERHAGDLGNIEADANGRAKFRFTDRVLTVPEIIGRSVVVTEAADDFGMGGNDASLIDGNSGRRLACGIIARSAGILQNFKRICACDGVTIWDERDKPIAGADRSNLK